MLAILETSIKTTLDESGRIVVLGADGQVRKNQTTLDPIPVKEAVAEFFTQNQSYLKGASGGGGGDDDKTPGSKKKLSDFQTHPNQ